MMSLVRSDAGMSNAPLRSEPSMSVVVQFPGMRAARTGQRNRAVSALGAPHAVRGGSVISWVRPASCDCCGRPTLAGRNGADRVTLCGHCRPPSVA